MMAKAHRAENFLLGEGLGRILLNAMLPMAVCAIFFDGVCSHILHEKMDAELQCIRDAGNSKKRCIRLIGIKIVVAFCVR